MHQPAHTALCPPKGGRACPKTNNPDLSSPSCSQIAPSRPFYPRLESRQIGGLGMDVYENEGNLFFTDWSDLPIEQRMDKWDRCFKLLCSYPQVGSGTG